VVKAAEPTRSGVRRFLIAVHESCCRTSTPLPLHPPLPYTPYPACLQAAPLVGLLAALPLEPLALAGDDGPWRALLRQVGQERL
jgi:hypothetical protein